MASLINLTLSFFIASFLLVPIKAYDYEVEAPSHTSRKLWLVFDRPKTTVNLDSHMGPGTEVVVRCWSSEDDCGQQKIEDGESYRIRFRPNISGTTQFVCSLAWHGGTLTNTFYDYHRDIHRCHRNCEWIVNTTAVYGISWNVGGVDLMFPWQPTGSKS